MTENTRTQMPPMTLPTITAAVTALSAASPPTTHSHPRANCRSSSSPPVFFRRFSVTHFLGIPEPSRDQLLFQMEPELRWNQGDKTRPLGKQMRGKVTAG